jgi:predicted nuclease with TOPRIM domain
MTLRSTRCAALKFAWQSPPAWDRPPLRIDKTSELIRFRLPAAFVILEGITPGRNTIMGVAEDVRSAVQDFVAPELRELRARIDALEEQQKQFRADVDKRFDTVDKRFDAVDGRFDKVDARFEKLEDKLSDMRDELITEIRRTASIYDLTVRVAKLESERPPAH